MFKCCTSVAPRYLISSPTLWRLKVTPAYNSEFWRLRVDETRALVDQMKEPDAKDAMQRLAEGHERLRLRRALDEANLAFNELRKKLRDNIGSGSQEKLAALRASTASTWATVQQIPEQLEAHIQAHPLLNK